MKIKFLLPESRYMEGLLASMDKYTSKIRNIKKKMQKQYLWDMPDNMLKVREYNMQRFLKIFAYQEKCNQLLESRLNNTAYLYMEQFNMDYLSNTFFEEANLLYLAKQLKAPHLDPEDPKNIFNLSYYILESVEAGFNLKFIRNCMDLFIADDDELRKYYRAVLKQYEYVYNSSTFYAPDSKLFKEYMKDLRMRLSALFSMKCLPGNETLSQAIDKKIEELKAKLEKDGKKSSVKTMIKSLGEYDFDKQKFNPLGTDPQKER